LIRNAEGEVTGVAVFARDTTKRRRAEEALLRIRDRLHHAEAISGVGGWEMDLAAQTLHWTNQTYHIHDLEPGAFTPTVETGLQFYAPESRPAITRAFQEAVATGRNYDLELELITARGRRIWVRTTSRTLLRDGAVVKVVGSFQDITERKAVEDALREREHRYRSLFENNHATMLIIDPGDGRIVDANPSACRFYGWPREELQAMRISQINTLPPEELQAEMDLARAEQRDYFRFLHRRSDGSVRHVDVFSGPISIEGRPLLYSIVHDTTERQQAEVALRESEHRYRLISENTEDVIWVMDLPQGRCSYVSPSVERLRGYTAGEVMSQNLEEALTADSHQRVLASMAERMPRYEAGDDTCRVTVMRVDQPCRDGSVIATEVITTLLKDGQGHVSQVLGVSRDITERNRTEGRIKEQLEELRRWQSVTLDREDRVQQLKREVNDLAHRLGEGVRYSSQAVDPPGAGPEGRKP
jgi:PAS domain S-box-containing protein